MSKYTGGVPPENTTPQKGLKDTLKQGTQEGSSVRLNKYIADAGICARRKADQLIGSGLVEVNGTVVTEMGFKVFSSDNVRVEGKTIHPGKMLYVLLNKPKDFITTTDDPSGRRTVMELVANAGATSARIYPVGRLDRNTTGLLLFTNDGALAEKLTHPSNKVAKLYFVSLNKNVSMSDLDQLRGGITLDDGLFKVDDIALLEGAKNELGVEIHSGKNRIVRRLFEHLGYEVVKLDRVAYAGLNKKDLKRGRWRYLTPGEVVRLKHFLH